MGIWRGVGGNGGNLAAGAGEFAQVGGENGQFAAAVLEAFYAAEPVLHWIGGPLAGEYKGADAIRVVWTKFTTAQAPLTVKVSNPHAMGTDTLMAETAFTGAKGNVIPVLLTEKAEGGKIKAETWKVNPPAAPAAAPAK